MQVPYVNIVDSLLTVDIGRIEYKKLWFLIILCKGSLLLMLPLIPWGKMLFVGWLGNKQSHGEDTIFLVG